MNLPKSLCHAYIITGGGEQSRRSFAARLSMAYVCPGNQPPCGKCRDCVKAAAGNHPDISLLTLEMSGEKKEKKKEITVDQARTLRADVYVRPNEAAKKVYLIDPADALNPVAQNVLLKVVEEGPPYAAFILIAGQPGALLETLRSRCETLALPPEEEAVDPGQWERAQKLAALLLDGDELALAVFLVGLENEGLKSAQVLDLYALTETALAPALARQPLHCAPVMQRLRSFRNLRVFNPGAGHLLGALAAGTFGAGRIPTIGRTKPND